MNRFHRLAAGLLALIFGLGSPAIAPAAHGSAVGTDIAMTDDDEATASPGETTGDAPEVEITSVGDPTMDEDQDLQVQAKISNPTSEPMELSSLSLLGHYATLSNRSLLLSFMEGADSALSLLRREPDSRTVAPGESATVRLTASAEDVPWSGSFDSWGPRGIELQVLLADGSELSDRSVVVVNPSVDLDPMPAGAAVPITQTPDQLASQSLTETIDGLGNGPESGDNTDEDGDENEDTPSPSDTPKVAAAATTSGPSAALDAVDQLGTPGVSLFFDPALLDEMGGADAQSQGQDGEGSGNGADEADGANATDGTPDFGQSLAQFNHVSDTELLFTPVHDVDAAALSHHGAKDELEDAYAGSEDVSDDLGLNAQTNVSLLPAGADQKTIDTLQGLDSRGVILSDQDIPQEGFAYATPSARTDIATSDGVMPALASDSAASTVLAGRMPEDQGGGELTSLDSRQMVLGLSALTYRERPNDSRAMVLAVDRAGMLGLSSPLTAEDSDPLAASNLSENLEALMGASWVQPETVSDMLKLDPSEAERQKLPAEQVANGEIAGFQMDQLASAQRDISTYATLSEDPSIILDPTRDAVFRSFATALRSNPTVRDSIISDVQGVSTQFSSALSVQPSSTINVISEATELPLHIDNELPVSAGVVIRIDSHDNRLAGQGDVTVKLPADTTTSVAIPVEARGYGNIQAEVRILDPEGNVIAPTQTVEIRVRADWENVGTLTIAIFLALVLVVGVVRSLRRGRKHDPVDPAESAGDQRASRRAVWESD